MRIVKKVFENPYTFKSLYNVQIILFFIRSELNIITLILTMLYGALYYSISVAIQYRLEVHIDQTTAAQGGCSCTVTISRQSGGGCNL